MAFIGHETDIEWQHLEAGDYFIIRETGEVFDHEQDAEAACYTTYLAYDEETDTEVDDDEPYTTYTKRTVEPWLVTRQRSFYRDFASVNICRGRDNIPPGMLCGTRDFAEVTECATREEAEKVAVALAARWAAKIEEPVEVEHDTSWCGGDTVSMVLPSGLIFDHGFEREELTCATA